MTTEYPVDSARCYTSEQDENQHAVVSARTSKRNRLSAAERRAKLESIKTQYLAGHPLLVIRLNLGLREEQLSKMLAELFMAGELTPIASTYEVLSVSQAIKSIPGFTVSADGYVRVTKTDSGVVLTSYIADGDEHA